MGKPRLKRIGNGWGQGHWVCSLGPDDPAAYMARTILGAYLGWRLRLAVRGERRFGVDFRRAAAIRLLAGARRDKRK